MAWTDAKACCRYARCPNTDEVEGRGLVTRAREHERGFCRDCWELLYTEDPRLSRLRRVRGEPFRLGESWSLHFVYCVEPRCADTRGRETREKHGGLGFCATCFRKLAYQPKRCVRCRLVRRFMAKRTKRGTLCKECYYEDYQRPVERCVLCGAERPVYKRLARGPICQGCYQHPVEACSACGREREVEARAEDGGALCSGCYEPPRRTCEQCGRLRPTAKFREDGGSVCHTCYRGPVGRCTVCERERPIIAGLCGACREWRWREQVGRPMGPRRITGGE